MFQLGKALMKQSPNGLRRKRLRAKQQVPYPKIGRMERSSAQKKILGKGEGTMSGVNWDKNRSEQARAANKK